MRLAPLNEALRATSGMPRRLTGDRAHRVLVRRPGEDRRHAAAARRGRRPAYLATAALPLSFQAVSGAVRVACCGQAQAGAADAVTSGSKAGQSTTRYVRNAPPAFVGPVTPKSLVAARTVTWCRQART